MSQHGPEPNTHTYSAIIKACINSQFSRREEILKIAKTLLRDIQDRGIQIHGATHKALMNLFAQGIDSKILIDLIPFLLDEVGEKHSGSILSIVLNSSLKDRQRGFHDAICDLSKDEHTRCTLGTENNSNAESQLKKSTQIELTEMVELLEMDTRQQEKKRTNHLSFPLNVKREHKISDILNPFETLPSVFSLPGRITSEDRKSLLDGIKEFRIRVHDAGGITDKWMNYRAYKTPMTIAIESSLLRLGLERTAVGTKLYVLPIMNRMNRRHDNAATKEMWRILEQSDKRKLVPHYFFNILCNKLDNERDVFQFLNFMQYVHRYLCLSYPILSDIAHQTSDIAHRTSDIAHHTSDIAHRTSDNVHQTSRIVHQTSYIRHPIVSYQTLYQTSYQTLYQTSYQTSSDTLSESD
ncbi:hypothetical protein FSP39_010585 [Pinctada imbricata]|uniref:Uncharacterized protein n=1 Tax=Pinctada imbricata TaxID=66713 RepID=A0AA88XE59_PINIB|nr:hypothetical protein FSP39_010585 [Pinctada imbricata]